MKTIALKIIFSVLVVSSIISAQNITNTLGTNGSFKIKDGTTDYLNLDQTTGNISLLRNIEIGGVINSTSTRGVITKNGQRFIHNYQAPGTLGYNTFIGVASGNFTLSGSGGASSYNTSVGYQSLSSLRTGSQNSSFGAFSLAINNSGNNNSAFGYSSMFNNNTGSDNSSFGRYSLYNNTGGNNNSAFGFQSLNQNSIGNNNSAFGSSSLFMNTGNNNSAFGYGALTNNTADDNSAFGYRSLFVNTTGIWNSSFGSSALSFNSTGSGNSAFGFFSLYNNNTGFQNAAFGSLSLRQNTTGANNSAFGHSALYNNSIGSGNSAFGSLALSSNTSDYNSAFGFSALYTNTNGYSNSAFGWNALRNSNGIGNTAVGTEALFTKTAGDQNTSIGYFSGYNITTGSNNITIGYNAQVPNNAGSNQVRIGDVSINYAGIQVAWTITSDRRWKENIQPLNLGLNFISELNPVSYTRTNDESHKNEFGLIAQEIEEVLDEYGIENTGMLTKTEEGMYELRYNDLLAPMIKAIQELKLENDKLRSELESLTGLKEELVEIKNGIAQLIVHQTIKDETGRFSTLNQKMSEE